MLETPYTAQPSKKTSGKYYTRMLSLHSDLNLCTDLVSRIIVIARFPAVSGENDFKLGLRNVPRRVAQKGGVRSDEEFRHSNSGVAGGRCGIARPAEDSDSLHPRRHEGRLRHAAARHPDSRT